MEEKKRKKIKLYSYLKVWNFEHKIYVIGNIVLPVPVNPFDILYFACACLAVYVLGRIIPAISSLPAILRLGVVPYGITKYMTKVKLDGKNPIRYMIGYLTYILTIRGKYVESYRAKPAGSKNIKLNWKCSEGWR